MKPLGDGVIRGEATRGFAAVVTGPYDRSGGGAVTSVPVRIWIASDGLVHRIAWEAKRRLEKSETGTLPVWVRATFRAIGARLDKDYWRVLDLWGFGVDVEPVNLQTDSTWTPM